MPHAQVAGRSRSTVRRCRASSSTSAIIPSLRPARGTRQREDLALRLPRQRQLAGQGARSAPAHYPQGDRGDRAAAGGLLPSMASRIFARSRSRRSRTRSTSMSRRSAASPPTNISAVRAAPSSSNISSPRRSSRPTAARRPRPRRSRAHIKALIAARKARRDPVRRHAGRPAPPRRLRHRAAHRRQISRGDRLRLVGAAPPSKGARGR